jgi:hypothetical protein
MLDALPRRMRAPVYELARHPGRGRELPASLSHPWSRFTVACAWLLWSLRRRSKRHGFSHVIDGYTQPMVCGLFLNAQGHPYSRSRLYATSYRKGSDECGPMRALKRAGVVHFAQPRTTEAAPRFVGPPHVQPDGSVRSFAFGVYWLPLEAPS